MKPPNIANFSHELRTKRMANAIHGHDHWVFRELLYEVFRFQTNGKGGFGKGVE
ncbi:hypothetical protein [Eubacterium callanderi]|uniref:hypothetical protein n=1 Tax=Eubacterium callanderi TaxID=53442 RepID=UPI001DDD57A5|nr:hypothetical protein [Eubacterium callanderi]MBS4860043.1 hypothetical protein [Eubacterium limosum]MCG4590947.1 hypothetical protein [Eubacterium callanderi]MCQ4822409.1 hypothetical protein [Eubacterium callanderi]MCQ4826709.1 hypothetical protein [Eubacterium callanderi]